MKGKGQPVQISNLGRSGENTHEGMRGALSKQGKVSDPVLIPGILASFVKVSSCGGGFGSASFRLRKDYNTGEGGKGLTFPQLFFLYFMDDLPLRFPQARTQFHGKRLGFDERFIIIRQGHKFLLKAAPDDG